MMQVLLWSYFFGTVLMPQRRCQCSFNRPSLLDALANPIALYPYFFTPCCKTLRATLIGQQNIFARITILFLSGCPKTIVRSIAEIVITSLNTMFGCGPWPHISQKRLKRLFPRWTDGNATSAIIFPCRIIGIRATLQHSRPYGVFRRLRFPMCACQFGDLFISLTSATLRVLTRQISPINKTRASTGADTPILYRAITSAWSHPKHKQSTESLTGKILKDAHRFNLLLLNAAPERMSRPVRKRACQAAHETALGTLEYNRGGGGIL